MSIYEEKRYEELMDKIEQSFNKTGQLDLYEKVLREKMPERVIRIYTDYLWEAAERANDRKKYQYLMSYLKKFPNVPVEKLLPGTLQIYGNEHISAELP